VGISELEARPVSDPLGAEITGVDITTVETEVNYLTPMTAKPVNYTFQPPPGVPWRSGKPEAHRIRVRNARTLATRPSLDEQGFALVDHGTSVGNFYDAAEVRSVYYPEVAELLKAATGAVEVVIFDHTLRSASAGQRAATGVREPVRYVHNDYTPWSGRRGVTDHLEAEHAAERLKGRHAVINVWRPIRGSVEEAPLAVCDAQSIAPNDLVPTDLVYPDRVGEVYSLTYNPEHRWFYYPAMAPGEVLLIKTYDSLEDGRARFTAHTAFDDPTTASDAAPRESIEVRALIFYPSASPS
jgi:hypothetical protein